MFSRTVFMLHLKVSLHARMQLIKAGVANVGELAPPPPANAPVKAAALPISPAPLGIGQIF